MVETPPTRADGNLTVNDARDRKHPSKPPAMLAAEGLVTSYAAPLPFESNTTNERAGVLGRVLKDVPLMDERWLPWVLWGLYYDPAWRPLRELHVDWAVDVWSRFISGRPAW
jgi:hypothetical protein